MNTLITAKYTSLVTKLVGIILILSSLVDFITLAIPAKILDTQWQLQFTNNVVDRGIVPLLGVILILIGYWIDSISTQNRPPKKKKKSFNFKSIIYILASLIGVAYLVLVPIHITNINEFKRITLIRINQQAEQSENQIRTQYEQLQELLNDPQAEQKLREGIQQIDNILGSGRQLTAQQNEQLLQNKQRLETYQGYLEDPALLDGQLEQLQTQLDERRSQRQTQANLESFKQIVRVALNSLLLAIAFSVIGWIGLRNTLKSSAKSAPSVD